MVCWIRLKDPREWEIMGYDGSSETGVYAIWRGKRQVYTMSGAIDAMEKGLEPLLLKCADLS